MADFSGLTWTDLEQVAFQDAAEAKEKIYGALTGLGWRNRDDVQVTPAREFGPGGWRNIEGEFDITISHPLAPDGQSYYARVKGAPNETVLRRVGKSFQHYTGDVKDVVPKGLEYVKEAGGVPYYTGIQSFARRIAAGLGETLQLKQRFPNDDTINWQDTVREIDFEQKNVAGGQFVMPVVNQETNEYVPIENRIPLANVMHEPNVSKENIRFMSGTYGVPLSVQENDRENVLRLLQQQVNEWGQSPSSPFAKLFGSAVFEPTQTSGGRLVTPWAAGSMYTSPTTGRTAADMIATTPMKHTYSVGRRPVAQLGVLSGTRLTPLDNRFLSQSSITLRSGEQSDAGIRMQALTAITPKTLPWQSGQMQVSLPRQLQEHITKTKGELVAMTEARRTLQLQGVSGPEQLINVPFRLNQEAIGTTLKQGSPYPIDIIQPDIGGLDPNSEEAKAIAAQISTRGITPRNQIEQIQGYTLLYPQAWKNRMSEEQLGNYFEQLRAKGFTNFIPHAKEQPYVQVEMLSATPVGPKGGGAKGQVDTPLIGVSQTLRTGEGGLSYNVLQEAKHPESVLYNALQAMPREQIPELLATLYKGRPEFSGMIDKAQLMVQSGAPLSLQDIGSSLYPTGEQTLLSISQALEGYGNQSELIKRFGLGFVKGRAPINQYTPETWKYLRESVVNDLMTNQFSVSELEGMGFQGERQSRALTQREAVGMWRKTYSSQAEYNRDTGLYTHFAEQQFLYHPKKQTFHQETVGVGSTQGEMEIGLRAQGLSGAAEFVKRLYTERLPESPARWGIKQITRGWMATQFGSTIDPATTQEITPEIATDVRNIMGQLILDPKYADRGRIGAMEAYGQALRLATGNLKGDEPLYHFRSSGVTIAGSEAFGETESLLTELRGEGLLVPQTQAHVASRWVRAVSGLLESESRGVPSLESRIRAQNLSGTYIDSDQIRKTRGGLFARYGGSTLLTPGEVAVSEQALRRHYIMQGGRGYGKEWKRYLDVMNNATAVGIRAPAPNIGSRGMPGSVFPLIMRTPQSKIGSMIFGAYESAGIRAPDFILSTLQRAQQGDVDLDPATLLPLAFRVQQKGGGADWVRYQGEGDYGEWIRKIFALQAVPAQQNTFQQIFGANAQKFDPWSSRMRAAVRYTMGDEGESLLNKRLAVETSAFQEHINLWNRVKQREMGSMYNSIIRRARVAATALGMPDEALAFTSDIGIEPYQTSIDLEIPKSSWAALMGTSGFFPQLSSTTGDLSLNWGWNVNFGGGKPDFTTGMTYWNPTQDISELASHVGRILASDKNANPEYVASMIMQQPRRQMDIGRRGDEEMNRLISQRRKAIADILRPAMETTGETRPLAINQAVDYLQQQGLIGERSVGVQSLMARALEYMNKDATRKQMTLDAINAQGGLLYGGKNISAEEWVSQTMPLTTLYSWQKHEPGVAAPYKNVLDIAELMLNAEQGAYENAPLMEQFVRQWGEMAGFHPGQQLSIRDPYTGKSRFVQSREDIAEMRATQDQMRAAIVDQWISGGGQGAVRKLSFSALGSQAAIAESGSIYEDMYNQSLTGSMMYGFRNPIFGIEGVGVNVTAPQQLSRYFDTGSKYTAAGDRIESMFAAINRKMGSPLGTHIGQIKDYSRVPRYEVQGENARYDIAGIPDFLKFSRGANEGEYTVDVYDVKNLASLRGKTAGAAIKDIKENPAYATQVPGYQTMFADIEWLRGDTEGAQNTRAMIREQLADDPENLAMFEEALEKGKSVTARGAYVASRYTPREAMQTGRRRRGMLGAIETGLGKLMEGSISYAGRGRSAPGMVLARMPDITTADVPAQQKIIAGQAEQAQGMARSLALQASLYQSYALKQHIQGDEGLRLQYGEQTITEAEQEAARFWQTKGREGETRYYERNPLRINPNISSQDLFSLREAIDINLATLGGGSIPLTRQDLLGGGAGRGGGGGGGRPIDLASLPDPEEPGRKRQATKEVLSNLQKSGMSEETLLKMASLMSGGEGGKGGIKMMFGRKTPMTSEQLTNFYRGFETMFKEQIGIQSTSEGFVPGELVQQFEKIPEMLAGQFSGEQATQIAALSPQQAIITAQGFATDQGVSFSKLLQKSGVGNLLGRWNVLEGMAKTLMPNLGKLDTSVTGGRDSFVKRGMMSLFGGAESDAQTLADSTFAPFMQGAPGTFETARKLKTAFSAGGTPAGEYGDIAQAWMDRFGKMIETIDKSTDSLVRGEKGFKDLNDMLDKTNLTGEKSVALMKRREALAEQEMMRWEKTVAVREAYSGTGFEKIGGRGQTLTPEEREFISSYVGSGEQGKAVKALMQKELDVAQARRGVAFTAADREVPGEEGGFNVNRLGRMGRSMLGGFGLMYMRNIWEIATGGARMGYEPYMGYQQMATPMIAGQYPGQTPFWTPEMEMAQSQLPYAGSGYAGLQRFMAAQYRDPRRAGAISLGQASIAGLGSGLWMGSMIGGPWGAILGGAGAILAPSIVSGLQGYGAATDVQGSGIGLASRYFTGEWDVEDYRNMMRQGNMINQVGRGMGADVAAGNMPQWALNVQRNIIEPAARWIASPLDAQRRAAQANPEIASLAMEILDIQRRREEAGGEVPLEEILRQMGYNETEIGQRTRWVAQAEAAQLDIPPEGVIGAELLSSRYGMDLTRGAGGGFQTLAGAVSMGAPWIQGAAQIAAANPWATFQQQEQETGNLLQLWSERGGISDEDLARLRLGAQRFAGLGTAAPDFRGDARRRRFKGQLGDMSAAQYGTFAREYQMGGMMRQMGLFWNPPSAEDYGTMGSQQLRQRERDLAVEQMRVNQMYNVYQGLSQLGISQPAMEGYEGMTSAQLANQMTQVTGAFGIQQQLQLAGAPNAQMFGQALGLMQGQIGRTMLGVLGGDRGSWARYALERPAEFAQLPMQLPGVGGSTINTWMLGMTDIRETPQGQVMTGMPWGTSSLAMPGIGSQDVAPMIWGAGFQGRSDLSQGLIGAMIQGGTFGGQMYQLQRQAAQSQAQAGIQLQQIALNRSFQTGVGIGGYSGIVNPQTGQPFGFNTGRFNVNVSGVGGFQTTGGGLWGVQDAMRGLGYMQQEWNFGRQREQLQMQDRFWQQNFNLNQRQALMQRPWRREDWAFQDTQRALQWGWRQEDFQENVRFTTGRERRLAERQMERETIMYGMEGEQIDKQRERQEELWKLEDQRFMIQEEQHKEQLRFSEEGIKTQEKFFEERKRLEEEQQKLQRAFQIKQLELSEKATAAAAAYAAEQQRIAQTMAEFSQFSQEASSQGSLFNEKTLDALADALEAINPELAKLIRQLRDGVKNMDKGGGGNDVFQDPDAPAFDEEGRRIPMQHGGTVLAGGNYLVGEAGPEGYRPYFTGEIIPNHKLDPYSNTLISPEMSSSAAASLIHLILNLGDQHFREYIIKTIDSEIDV